MRLGGLRELIVLVEAVEEVVEVSAGVAPVDWVGGRAPLVLEGDDALEFAQAVEVAWGERFALQD